MDRARMAAACLAASLACGCDGTGDPVPTTETLDTATEDLAAAAVRGVLPGSSGAACLYGTSDGSGDVAFGFTGAVTSWHMFAADGTPRGVVSDSATQAIEDDIYPAASRFQLAIDRPPFKHAGFYLGTFTPAGIETAEVLYGGDNVFLADLERSAMPAGGVFTAQLQEQPTLTGFEVQLHWIAADATLLGTADFTTPSTVASIASSGGATDRRGRTLVFFPGAAGLDARWFDSDGSARGPSFAWPTAPPELAPLIGGGFAVRAGAAWVGVIASDGRQLLPAPQWLARRPSTKLAIVARGLLYALLLDDGEALPPAPQRIELRAPWGTLLARVSEPAPSGSFSGQRTRIGRDGTVAQLFTETSGGGTQCAYRYFPHLLR